MTNKEIVIEVLSMYNCCTSKEIVHFAKLRLNQNITSAQVAGILRSMISYNQAGSSKNDKNVTVYWLI